MAVKTKKTKIGSKILRVKCQRPPKKSSSIANQSGIFIGKPTPTYSMPSSLGKLLEKYVGKNCSLNIPRSTKSKKGPNRKTIVNGFTAFRTYYSKFGKTYKEQEELSKELADFWKKMPALQTSWHSYSEEYKAADTELSFVTWFDQYKSEIQEPKTDCSLPVQQSSISHLIVEDIYTFENHQYTTLN